MAFSSKRWFCTARQMLVNPCANQECKMKDLFTPEEYSKKWGIKVDEDFQVLEGRK
jgi:hypothetical protein